MVEPLPATVTAPVSRVPLDARTSWTLSVLTVARLRPPFGRLRVTESSASTATPVAPLAGDELATDGRTTGGGLPGPAGSSTNVKRAACASLAMPPGSRGVATTTWSPGLAVQGSENAV